MNSEGIDDDSTTTRHRHAAPKAISADAAAAEAEQGLAGRDLTDDVPVSHEVITALSAELGIDPLEMKPLYEFVDPDALDALFASVSDRGTDVMVTFDYDGRAVTVTAGGQVTIVSDERPRPTKLDDRL